MNPREIFAQLMDKKYIIGFVDLNAIRKINKNIAAATQGYLSFTN